MKRITRKINECQEVKQLFKGEIMGNSYQGSENKNKIYREEMDLKGMWYTQT
jgi:hypothetical protein